jgi:hypothetical protein
LAYKIQTPGNHPKERIQHSKHSKSLKPRSYNSVIKNIHKAAVNKQHLDNCTGTAWPHNSIWITAQGQLDRTTAIDNYLLLHT